jgi:signal transduction histidine kinase
MAPAARVNDDPRMAPTVASGTVDRRHIPFEVIQERLRIARELHDCLLQLFHLQMFRLEAMRDLLPDRAHDAALLLDEALKGGASLIASARDAKAFLDHLERDVPSINGA